MTFNEPKDNLTGKSPIHQKNALKSNPGLSGSQIIVNTESQDLLQVGLDFLRLLATTVKAEYGIIAPYKVRMVGGKKGYIVGGAVRDYVMNKPIHDIDITTEATPAEIEELTRVLNLVYVPTGLQHGTVTVVYKSHQIQITTYRIDKVCDGRHAVVEFCSNLSFDLERRDITANAMAMDSDMNIIDLFGGQEDIKNKIIRAVGLPLKRFVEDKLRLLRAIRFATVLGFTIEPKTWEAMKEFRGKLKVHSKHMIYGDGEPYEVDARPISDERIRDELVKILESPNRSRGLELMDELGMLDEILPEVVALKGLMADPKHHPERDTFLHTMLSVKSLPPDTPVDVAITMVLHDIGKAVIDRTDNIHFLEHETKGAEMTDAVLRRFKFPGDFIDKVKWLVANHMKLYSFGEMRKAKKIRLIEHQYFSQLYQTYKADRSGRLKSEEAVKEEMRDVDEFLKEYETMQKVKPRPKVRLVTGFDVMQLGVKEGIQVGKLLTAVEDEIIEGKITTRDEAINWLKKAIDELNK